MWHGSNFETKMRDIPSKRGTFERYKQEGVKSPLTGGTFAAGGMGNNYLGPAPEEG